MISIEVIQGPDKGRTFRIDDGEVIIGRQSETLPLTDATVSRRHARFIKREKGWILEDVGSVNGTFLNGVRVSKPSRVHLGDQIRCGSTLLVMGSQAEQAPAMHIDESSLDAAIVATVPASEDSVIIPTPEAGVQAIENLRILYNLVTDVSSIFSTDQLIQRTLDVILDIVHADRAYILLIGPDGQLAPKAVRTRSENIDPAEMPISRTIINEVIRNQVGVLSSNAMRDKRFSRGKSVHAFGIRSAIVAPIKGREKVLGVIHVDSSVADYTYSTEQLRLLTAVGYQTGLALDNVRLYEAQVQSERLAAIGETVATLSHHIKNILQALGGGTELVEKALAEGNLDKAHFAWPIVRRNLDRINGVILNMLAFSKAREPVMEHLNINHVLNECLDLIGPQAEERSVAIVTDLGDLPPIPADASGLHQAFLNLLNNALDAVADNSGVITVTSSFDTMNRLVIVTVADNGVGIEPDQIGMIFEAFHSTKGHKGTGLGLAVTKKAVEEHGGRITVASKAGAGTTFTVQLSSLPGGIPDSSDTQAR